jgi:uncharacterized repeat protein (TIGR03803 family)
MLRFPSQVLFFRVAAVVALIPLVVISARSASYKVLFNFNRTSGEPSSGLVVDSQGNAYGTTFLGGHNNAGSVYELSPTAGYHLLYPFSLTGPGGENPQGNLVFDSGGNLYGTTVNGGISNSNCLPSASCGVVFKLSPPTSNGDPWTETVLYDFCSQSNCTDGFNPESGVIFDSQGNLYGTAYQGGDCSHCGVVFELSPPSGGVGLWTETVLYNFCSQANCVDGKMPYGGLIFDSAGNLYGTTTMGGAAGTVFRLSPTNNGWVETVLHNFEVGSGDGVLPYGGLAFDGAGNLYGTTTAGGNTSDCFESGCGVVFELTPTIGGGWTETILHTFNGSDGAAPYAGVVLDSANNLYGTTRNGGNGPPNCGEDYCGTVFKLTTKNNGQWSIGVFRFPEELTGSNPEASVTLDSAGNVYGTTAFGGTGKGSGVVFRITQP